MADGVQSFLSEPQWRAIPEYLDSNTDIASVGIRLRSELSNYLIDAPVLIIEAHKLLGSRISREDNRIEHLMARITDLERRVQAWYRIYVIPHITITIESSGSATASDATEASERIYPKLIFAFVDCVICSLLATLEDLVDRLGESHECPNARFPSRPLTPKSCATRRNVARSAFIFVQARSEVSVKQLSFGLSRLGFNPLSLHGITTSSIW